MSNLSRPFSTYRSILFVESLTSTHPKKIATVGGSTSTSPHPNQNRLIMVKLNLRSSLFHYDQADNQGRRRSQRIQQQQLRKQQEQLQLEASMNVEADSNQRTSPGQRRSFDDINNAPAGSSQVLRRIFSNTSNKKSRRSTSAAGRNNKQGTAGGGVIRSVATMFRPSSSAGRRETGATALLSSGAGSFETLEVMDTSQNSFPGTEDCDMTVEDVDPVLAWMQTDAPPDVLPKILSFCGSRKVNALSRVNKTWNKIITSDDLIWREMCEATHKVNSFTRIPALCIFCDAYLLTLDLPARRHLVESRRRLARLMA